MTEQTLIIQCQITIYSYKADLSLSLSSGLGLAENSALYIKRRKKQTKKLLETCSNVHL